MICNHENPYGTTCRDCPEGTYMSTQTYSNMDVHKCRVKTVCGKGEQRVLYILLLFCFFKKSFDEASHLVIAEAEPSPLPNSKINCRICVILFTSTGQITTDEGSRDHHRQCSCDLESGFYDYDLKEHGLELGETCFPRECPAGEELHLNGNFEDPRTFFQALSWFYFVFCFFPQHDRT